MDVITLIQGDEDSELTPFFMIHAISGVALPFLHLEPLSEDDDRPVYGITSPLHCPGGDEYKYPQSLGDLAASYLKGIKEIQPEGPYLLGGWSMGGMIAMFMAQILQAQGEEVIKIIMIDSTNPEVFPHFTNAEEHKEFSKATYDRTVAYGLQLDAGSSPNSPIPTPAASEMGVEDYLTARGRRMSAWAYPSPRSSPRIPQSPQTPQSAHSSVNSFASSSASSLFDTGSPYTPMSPISEPYTDDESDCESDCESDLDCEPPQVKDFLRQTKLHIHKGLGLIAGVNEGELFTPGKKSNFDVVLVKCSPAAGETEMKYHVNENVRFIHKVMSQRNMMWNPSQFKSFQSIPFSGEHDGAFAPQFVGELSEILRECLEDIED